MNNRWREERLHHVLMCVGKQTGFTVTIAARLLQSAGLIRYHRGHIQVLDRAALENISCECYAVTRQNATRASSILPRPRRRSDRIRRGFCRAAFDPYWRITSIRGNAALRGFMSARPSLARCDGYAFAVTLVDDGVVAQKHIIALAPRFLAVSKMPRRSLRAATIRPRLWVRGACDRWVSDRDAPRSQWAVRFSASPSCEPRGRRVWLGKRRP